jgi:hypothetical protein
VRSSPGIEAQLATALALEAELQQELELRETGERIRQLQKRLERVDESEASFQTVASSDRSLTPASSISHDGVPRSWRPRAISEYKGKTVREHSEFITSCELAFRLEPEANKSDELRCDFAATWLAGEPRDAWLRHERELGSRRRG